MYVFLISERGERTNICSNIKLITLETLIKYMQEDLILKEKYQNKEIDWRELKSKSHFLDSYFKQVRVGKVDDSNFQTRILKYISLEEFEEIFEGHIEDIAPLLEYKDGYSALFKKEVLKKYGRKIN